MVLNIISHCLRHARWVASNDFKYILAQRDASHGSSHGSSLCIYLRAGGVPTRHTHKWDGLHTRHLLRLLCLKCIFSLWKWNSTKKKAVKESRGGLRPLLVQVSRAEMLILIYRASVRRTRHLVGATQGATRHERSSRGETSQTNACTHGIGESKGSLFRENDIYSSIYLSHLAVQHSALGLRWRFLFASSFF